jgi:hypothetical protein
LQRLWIFTTYSVNAIGSQPSRINAATSNPGTGQGTGAAAFSIVTDNYSFADFDAGFHRPM